VTAPRSRRVALATGLTYHALEWGAGEHTVLLLHGFLDLAWGWEEVAALLGERYRVIAPDLRGHGDSDWVGAGGYYHFPDYVADVDDLVRRLGDGRLSVVGHSMGGSIASYWAGARPDRAHRIALLEGLGPPEVSGDPAARVGQWIDAWRAARTKVPRRMASVDEAAERLRRHDELLDGPRARRLAEHGTRPDGDGVVWKHDPLHLTMGPYPFRRDYAEAFWRRIAAPVLAVDASRSRLRHASDEAAQRLSIFRDVRTATVDDAGHMMQRHQPAALAALLTDFLGA
jgi:pimeloyl-ACP methyl ester carboxylesterase